MIDLIVDERKCLPSASSFHRVVLCPGSVSAENAIPKLANNSSFAISGTRIHKALADDSKYGEADISDFSESEKQTYHLCKDQRQIVIESWSRQGFCEKIIEERFWLHDGLNRIASGQPDLIIVEDARALVIDYKTGFGEYDEIEGNWQLRFLAVLAYVNLKSIDEVTVCIIQPNTIKNPTLCLYSKRDLILSKSLIFQAIDDSKKINAPRNSGLSQCKYCRAKLTCPEANRSIQTLNTWKPVTPEDKAKRLELFLIAEGIIETEREQYALEIAQNPDAIPGWKVIHGRNQTVPVEGMEVHVKEQQDLLKKRLEDEGCFENRFVNFKKPSLKKIKEKK